MSYRIYHLLDPGQSFAELGVASTVQERKGPRGRSPSGLDLLGVHGLGTCAPRARGPEVCHFLLFPPPLLNPLDVRVGKLKNGC